MEPTSEGHPMRPALPARDIDHEEVQLAVCELIGQVERALCEESVLLDTVRLPQLHIDFVC